MGDYQPVLTDLEQIASDFEVDRIPTDMLRDMLAPIVADWRRLRIDHDAAATELRGWHGSVIVLEDGAIRMRETDFTRELRRQLAATFAESPS